MNDCFTFSPFLFGAKQSRHDIGDYRAWFIPVRSPFFGLAGFLSDDINLSTDNRRGFFIRPRTVENIIVILFEISFIALAIHARNIDDIPRMKSR